MSNAGPYSGKGAQGGKGKWNYSVENEVAADFGSDSRGVEGKGGVAHYSGFVENVGAAKGGSRSCGSEGMGGDGGSDSSFGHGKGDCGCGKGKYMPVWHGTAAEWARAWRTAYGGGSVENQAAAAGGSDSHGMEGKGGGDGGSGRSYGSEGKGGSGGVGLRSYGRKGERTRARGRRTWPRRSWPASELRRLSHCRRRKRPARLCSWWSRTSKRSCGWSGRRSSRSSVVDDGWPLA